MGTREVNKQMFWCNLYQNQAGFVRAIDLTDKTKIAINFPYLTRYQMTQQQLKQEKQKP
jgi:hypothetical protein